MVRQGLTVESVERFVFNRAIDEAREPNGSSRETLPTGAMYLSSRSSRLASAGKQTSVHVERTRARVPCAVVGAPSVVDCDAERHPKKRICGRGLTSPAGGLGSVIGAGRRAAITDAFRLGPSSAIDVMRDTGIRLTWRLAADASARIWWGPRAWRSTGGRGASLVDGRIRRSAVKRRHAHVPGKHCHDLFTTIRLVSKGYRDLYGREPEMWRLSRRRLTKR